MLIDHSLHPFGYFNACFVQYMLSLSLYSMLKGYVPHIELKDIAKGDTNWDTFFKQPFDTNITETTITNERPIGYLTYGFDIAWNKKKLARFCRLYRSLVHYNDKTLSYINEDYNAIISANERVLGVLCRGTDYLQLKPKGHPVQPSIEAVIEKVRSELKANKYDKIYLATEDDGLYKQFVSAFADYKIIANKRQYYGESYQKVCKDNPSGKISDVVFDDQTTNYWLGIQYLSSMEILSRCNSLIASNCGGTCLALLMNNMKYENVYVFNLGLYK